MSCWRFANTSGCRFAGSKRQDKPARAMVRSRFEAPNTVWINKRLKSQEHRLKYELAFFAGHRIMHNGDGLISPHEANVE